MEYYTMTNQQITVFDADEYAAYKIGYTFVLSSLQEIAENGKQDDIAAYFDQGFKSVNDAGINDLHIHMKS